MFGFIVKNIFVLLPIAVFIGMRIVEARKRAQNARERDSKPTQQAYGEDSSYFRPEPEAVWRESSVTPVIEKSAKPKRPPAARKVQEVLPVFRTTVEEIPQAKPAPNPDAGLIPAKFDLEKKLKAFSPLQRAVVMTEILGQPKGF